jgi:hypothetical protein
MHWCYHTTRKRCAAVQGRWMVLFMTLHSGEELLVVHRDGYVD